MDWLNYHQMYYFWVVSREGTMTRASKVLHVGQPTLSVQIRALEKQLGQPLFLREGRRLNHTEAGATVYRYAEEIFSLGQEMIGALGSGVATSVGPIRLSVGVTDSISKLVVCRLLEPAMRMPETVIFSCYEAALDRLLGRLTSHELDMVLSDAPLPYDTPSRVFAQLLLESPVSFMGTAALVKKYTDNFPQSLHEAPLFLPTRGTQLRRLLDQWFLRLKIVPKVLGEAEDAAMLKVLGRAGTAMFPCPSVIETGVAEQYGVKRVGITRAVRERYFAVTAKRRIEHPAAAAIIREAADLTVPRA